ncbi:Putative inner membrane protein [Klebsiella pneumoniae IS33]|nr:Putative inner membrane protein [Klebsiella pneumoniae IS33]
MNASLTLACLIAAGVGLVVQNTLMVRITQSASTILIAMLLNSLVGIVIFVTMLLLRQGVAGFQELALSVKWWTLIPGLLGSFFVFASISGYQNVGAATTIAVLVASQLVGGLIMDLVRAHGVPVRALIGPLCGAVMLVVGAWLVARRPVLSASSEDRAPFGQLLAARILLFLMLSPMMGDGGAQTLLLDIAFLTTELRIITQGD